MLEFDEAAATGEPWMRDVATLLAADRLAEALARAKEAFVQSVRAGDQGGKVSALHVIAKVQHRQGELTDASEVAEKTLAELLGSPNELLHGAVMHTIAKVSRDLYRVEDALEFAEEALKNFQRAGSRIGEAAVLNTIALTNLRRGKKQDALKVAKQSLAIFRDCQEREGQAEALQTLARASLAAGRSEDALRAGGQLVELYDGSPDVGRRGLALLALADVQAAAGEHADAVDTASRVVESYEGLDKLQQAYATRRLADACFAKGGSADGWMYAKEALELYRDEGHVKGEAQMLYQIAVAHFSVGSFQDGEALAQEGIRLCRESGLRQLLAHFLAAVARTCATQEVAGLAREQHLNWRARQLAKEALAIYEDIGDVQGQMQAHNTLATAFMSYGNVVEGRARAKRAGCIENAFACRVLQVELSQLLGDKTNEGINLMLVAQSRFHDNKSEAIRLATLAQRLIRDGGNKAVLAEADEVLDALREEPRAKPKAKSKAAGVVSFAETQATRQDLTLDFDMMKTRAIYFSGFTSRRTR